MLGAEAADSMADWMNRSDEKHDELRRDLAEFRQTVRADFAELRQEMNAKFADLRQEMNVQFADVRQEMRVGFAQVDAKFAGVYARFADMEKAAANRHAEFMRWMLGFWAASLVTLIGAVVGVATVLR